MRILLVDDDPDTRALTALCLRAAAPGVELAEAGEPLAFAQRLASGGIDAAIGRRRLAWADGLKALSAVRERCPQAALVLLANTADSGPLQAMLEAGIDAHAPRTAAGFLALPGIVTAAVERRDRAAAGAIAALSRLPVGAFTLDVRGNFEYANPTLLELLGLPPGGTLTGLSLESLIIDAARQAEAAACIQAGRALREFDAPVERVGGGRLWARINAAPVATPGGGRAWHGVLQDVSLLKEADANLAGRADALRRSNQELEQIAYAMSHDLQEPLQLVTRHARLLREHLSAELSEEAARSLGHLADNAERMRAMIDGVLEYARLAAGAPRMQPVDLAEIVEDVFAGFADSAAETSARLEHGELPVVEGNAQQLTQLLHNLVGNALKFRSQAAPRVRVDAEKSDDTWRLGVADNGIGIAPTDTHRVFGMFQRLHTPQEYPGTGIGLAMCKRIAEAHGGSISVSANPGGGSVFVVTLPQRPATAAPRDGGRNHAGGR